MYERTYGNKYNGKLTTVEIAKLVRQDIKKHIEAGCLPDGKYSVRSHYFAGGSSIGVYVRNLEHGIYTAEYLEWVKKNEMPPRGTSCYTPVAQNVLDTCKAILDQYNHDGCEIQVDYFDVNFYSNVAFDWQWVKEIHGHI